jgi:hypothetical protein
MVRDKVQAVAAMRVCMGKLRPGNSQLPPNPTSGRGGGRGGGGYGRGYGQSSSRKEDMNNEESKGPHLVQAEATTTKTTATEDASMGRNDEAPTISDLTEQTEDNTTEMEEYEDPLALLSPKLIPSTIEKFIPNTQWIKDIPKVAEKALRHQNQNITAKYTITNRSSTNV